MEWEKSKIFDGCLQPRKNKKIAYICGPMTGYPGNNYPSFFRAEEILKKYGFKEILNPASNPIPKPETWENYMKMAISQLVKADLIVLLPGWKDSKGACIEVELAEKLGIDRKLIGGFRILS